jgi:hypothetical protein
MLAVVLAAALGGNAAGPISAAETRPPASPAYPPASLPVTFERFAYVTRNPARFQSPRLRTYAALAAEPCLTYTYGVNGRTASGTMTYSWAEEVGWCYDGAHVTYASVVYRPRSAIGWGFLEINNKTEQWAADKSFFQARSVAKFGYSCILPNGGGCAFYRFPYVGVVVYGNGTYSGSGSSE